MKWTIRILINAFLTLVLSNDLFSQNNFLTPRAAIFQKYFTLKSSDCVVLGNNHHGKIISIKTSKFYLHRLEGENVRGAYCSQGLLSVITKQLFDPDGRQLENLKLDSLNNLIEGDFFHYNSRGNLKKRRTFTKYEFGWEGKKLINKDVSTTFFYNDAGVLFETNDLDIDGRVLCKKVFHYNDQFDLIGNVQLCLRKNENHKIRMTHIFKQVVSNNFTIKNIKDGYIIRQQMSFEIDRNPDSDKSITKDSLLHYEGLFKELVLDTVLNLKTETYFDTDGGIMSKIKIDSLGREIWKQVNLGYIKELFTTDYNDHNDEIKLTYFDKDGKALVRGVKTFDYKYDENGNWITKTEKINNVPTYLYFREIEYAK